MIVNHQDRHLDCVSSTSVFFRETNLHRRHTCSIVLPWLSCYHPCSSWIILGKYKFIVLFHIICFSTPICHKLLKFFLVNDKNPFTLPSQNHSYSLPGPWFNIKISSYQYRKSHCGDKTVVRSSYLHNGISYTGKMSSLYWTGAQAPFVTRTSTAMASMNIFFSEFHL